MRDMGDFHFVAIVVQYIYSSIVNPSVLDFVGTFELSAPERECLSRLRKILVNVQFLLIFA